MAAIQVLRDLRAQGSLRILSAVILGLLLVAASVPGLLMPYDPREMSPVERLLPPSWAHPLGTDETGRDVLARILHGARVSVGAAVGLVAVTAAVGGLVGLVAGWIGGRGEEFLMRVCDLFLSFPQLLLAIGIVTVIGRGMLHCVLTLAVAWWPQYARLMRGQVLVVRDREFVLAAHALGQRRGAISSRTVWGRSS
jgi:peptide/nickel transport system permease protein